MRWPYGLLTAFILLSVLSCSVYDEAEQAPSLVCKSLATAEGDKQRLLYEDDTLMLVAVDYGDATKQSKPGFYVFRKATADWIRIDKVFTRGGIFGRSPTFQEVKEAGKSPASIGWDFRNLAEKNQVDFPLTSAGFLFFPDKVERDEKRKEYVLHFNSDWEIKGVETVLRLRIDELTKSCLTQSPADDVCKAVFDKNKFEKILPKGWYVENIKENDHPYGYLEDEKNNGSGIFLKGPTEVKDKGKLTTKESISIWIMPLSYPADKVPKPGTPHLPAKLIGVNENYKIFVLPWNDTPSWKSWENDLILFFETYPRLGILGYPLKTDITIEGIKKN